jgi:hypothetical protein
VNSVNCFGIEEEYDYFMKVFQNYLRNMNSILVAETYLINQIAS